MAWVMARITISGNTVKSECEAVFDTDYKFLKYPKEVIPCENSEFFLSGEGIAIKYKSTPTEFVELDMNTKSPIVKRTYFKEGMDCAVDLSGQKISSYNHLVVGLYSLKDLAPVYIGADVGRNDYTAYNDVFQDGEYIVATRYQSNSSSASVYFYFIDAKCVTRTTLSAAPMGRAVEINGNNVTMSIL